MQETSSPKQKTASSHLPASETCYQAIPNLLKAQPKFGQTNSDLRLKHLWHTFQRKLANATPGPLVIGISGGLDSCALLHLLYLAHNPHKNPIYPCYIQHGIRRQEIEAEGLPQFCQALSIPFHSWRIQAGWLECEARRQGLSLEALARRERYRRLENYAQDLACEKTCATIVLAHHADDQAESFFMNIARGSGPSALAGMREKAVHCKGAKKLCLWRPLLEWQHQDLHSWIRLYRLPHWEDSSNFDQKTLRNFYRWQVLPQLKRMLPGLFAGIQRSQQHIAIIDDWLQEQRQVLGSQLLYTWESTNLELQQPAKERLIKISWPGNFGSLAPPLQLELVLLLFDNLRAGEQRRRRLPLGFAIELQRQWRQHCQQGQKKNMCITGHRCLWQISRKNLAAEICL